MDLSYGTVFCFACNDYMYDPELETISTSQHQKSAKAQGTESQIYIINVVFYIHLVHSFLHERSPTFDFIACKHYLFFYTIIFFSN